MRIKTISQLEVVAGVGIAVCLGVTRKQCGKAVCLESGGIEHTAECTIVIGSVQGGFFCIVASISDFCMGMKTFLGTFGNDIDHSGTGIAAPYAAHSPFDDLDTFDIIRCQVG